VPLTLNFEFYPLCATSPQPAELFTCHASPPHKQTQPQTTQLTPPSRAPSIPQVQHTDDSVSSLVDVDSPHISSVPSDYESQSIKTDTQAERKEREQEIAEEAKNLKERAAAKKESAKDKARKNADNPVVLANAIGGAVLAGVLGIGAYRKYARGELTGKVVAAWMGVVGLFGLGDYYVSQ
jgi:Rho-type GTPase-activating protein 1/2